MNDKIKTPSDAAEQSMQRMGFAPASIRALL